MLVDDEKAIRDSAAQTLMLAGYEVETFAAAKQVLEQVDHGFAGVVITDIRMPEMDGLELMEQLLKLDHDLPVILISGHADVSMAVHAIRDGAYDLLEKPFASAELVDTVKRALEKRRLTLENRDLKAALDSQTRPGPRIIGQAPAIVNLRSMIARVANVAADVLVWGETGTGKELVADRKSVV